MIPAILIILLFGGAISSLYHAARARGKAGLPWGWAFVLLYAVGWVIAYNVRPSIYHPAFRYIMVPVAILIYCALRLLIMRIGRLDPIYALRSSRHARWIARQSHRSEDGWRVCAITREKPQEMEIVHRRLTESEAHRFAESHNTQLANDLVKRSNSANDELVHSYTSIQLAQSFRELLVALRRNLRGIGLLFAIIIGLIVVYIFGSRTDKAITPSTGTSNETPETLSLQSSKESIHEAAANGNEQLVSQLLTVNKSLLDSRDGNEMTPLHVAAREGKAEVVNLLLSKGADINAQYKNGGTALHLAALNGHREVIKALLSKRADATIRNSSGETARQVATQEKLETVTKVFIEFGL